MKKLVIAMVLFISLASYIPKNVEVTQYGMQITFMDNTGYFQEF